MSLRECLLVRFQLNFFDIFTLLPARSHPTSSGTLAWTWLAENSDETHIGKIDPACLLPTARKEVTARSVHVKLGMLPWKIWRRPLRGKAANQPNQRQIYKISISSRWPDGPMASTAPYIAGAWTAQFRKNTFLSRTVLWRQSKHLQAFLPSLQHIRHITHTFILNSSC